MNINKHTNINKYKKVIFKEFPNIINNDNNNNNKIQSQNTAFFSG